MEIHKKNYGIQTKSMEMRKGSWRELVLGSWGVLGRQSRPGMPWEALGAWGGLGDLMSSWNAWGSLCCSWGHAANWGQDPGRH